MLGHQRVKLTEQIYHSPRLGISPFVTEQYKRQTEQSEDGISPKIMVVFNALALRQGREHLKPKEL